MELLKDLLTFGVTFYIALGIIGISGLILGKIGIYVVKLILKAEKEANEKKLEEDAEEIRAILLDWEELEHNHNQLCHKPQKKL